MNKDNKKPTDLEHAKKVGAASTVYHDNQWLDERERAKGVPPKMKIRRTPIVKVPEKKKQQPSELLVKILVQYGEQCHYDGYITEESINQATETLQAHIDTLVTEAKISELKNALFNTATDDNVFGYLHTRIAELKENL